MLRIIFFLVLLVTTNVSAQMDETIKVKAIIDTFFEGFHKQDSLIIMQVISNDIIMQSIGKDREGQIKIRNEKFDDFLKSVLSIPEDKKFEEKLLDYIIKVDGNMANVWMPYEFWLNGEFSHCGVNSFQLFNDNGRWKIIYIIDTRRKTGCNDKN